MEEDIGNTGLRYINLPDTTTQFGHFIVHSKDSYGNIGIDASDAYMILGQEETDDFEQITTDVTVYSSSFTVDTKLPEFLIISIIWSLCCYILLIKKPFVINYFKFIYFFINSTRHQ